MAFQCIFSDSCDAGLLSKASWIWMQIQPAVFYSAVRLLVHWGLYTFFLLTDSRGWMRFGVIMAVLGTGSSNYINTKLACKDGQVEKSSWKKKRRIKERQWTGASNNTAWEWKTRGLCIEMTAECVCFCIMLTGCVLLRLCIVLTVCLDACVSLLRQDSRRAWPE